VPGSTASYPSSVLMNAIPAIVAGVKRIVMINPGLKENKIQQFYMLLVNVKLKKFIQLEVHLQLQQLLMELKKLKKLIKL
jgi:histidinol dehydrogenase